MQIFILQMLQLYDVMTHLFLNQMKEVWNPDGLELTAPTDLQQADWLLRRVF